MYKALFERWQEELASEALLSLRDSFLQNARVYIERVLVNAKESSEVQKQIYEAELANLRFMLNQLIQLRVQKILLILSSSNSVDYDLLTRQERRFADQISKNIRNVFEVVNDLFTPLDADESSRFLLIRFLEDHPPLIGVDLRTYGPFRADDLAIIPLENARIIIRRNGAEPVTTGASYSESPKNA